ncbi:isochorismatase family protein [Burkholderia gladioli]|uniref:isochorismatase family protein n=2 Tax=Burkholderia gladioli TaxID=28095 RepID=UPI003132A8F0
MPSPRSIPARALLLVDMQHGLFRGAEAPYQAKRVLANIQRLVARAREAGAMILAARHVGPPGTPIEPGSPLARLLPELGIDPGRDWIFDKARPNCFVGTGLAERLAQAGVKELAIAGMKTQRPAVPPLIMGCARCCWPMRIPAWIRRCCRPTGSSRITISRWMAHSRRC